MNFIFSNGFQIGTKIRINVGPLKLLNNPFLKSDPMCVSRPATCASLATAKMKKAQ